MSNPGVSLTAPPDYATQLLALQRNQKLADLLQQQASEPLQTNFGNAPAPISWTSLLAKGLQSGLSANLNRYDSDQQKTMGAQDQKSAQALVQNVLGVPPSVGPMPQPTGPLSGDAIGSAGPMPMASGPSLGAAPMASPSIPSPGAANVPTPAPMASGPTPSANPVSPGAPTAAAPDNSQLAAALIARGGPQTEAIQRELIPYILQRQERQAENQQNIANQTVTPLSDDEAAALHLRQGGVYGRNKATGNITVIQPSDLKSPGAIQQEQQQETFENQMQPTPYQQAQLRQSGATLAETRRHNEALEGGGIGADLNDPVTQSWVANVKAGNATMNQVPAPLRSRVSMALQATPTASYSPLAGQRFATEATRITHPLTALPQYQLTANGLPYLQRIDAALKVPGSVSDQDLLDSLTKLNTAGNAVTDAQVKLITDGKSYSDWLGTIGNKFQNGGVLSTNQRQQIKEIANNIYANYKKGYQPVYDQAAKQLTDAGVPKAFWTIPDLNALNAPQSAVGGASAPAPNPGGQTVIRYDANGNRIQ